MECPSKSLKIFSAGIAMAIFIFQVSCSKKATCVFKEIKTMWTLRGIQAEVDTSYSHSVLIKEFSRECLDSSVLINIALKYKDTVSIDTPISVIFFYNSDKGVDYGRPSQENDVNRNLLLSIWFDEISGIKEFIFYDNKGNIIYKGKSWITKR